MLEWARSDLHISLTSQGFYPCAKRLYFNTSDLDHMVPRATTSLLQEFDDLFRDDTPNGLPPLRGKEHKTNLVHEASILNRAAYI